MGSLKLNTDSGGSVTFSPQSTSNNITMTVPTTSSSNLVVESSLAGALSAAVAPGTSGNVLTSNGTSWVSSTAKIDTYTYDNRNDLRLITPDDESQAIIEELGYFVFDLGSTELDDDETCFATSTGRWLLQAASFELVEALQIPADSAQDDALEQINARFLFGSAFFSITSVAAVTQVSAIIVVPGAEVGDAVAVSPGNALTGRISIFARVTEAGTVTVYINNPSAATETLTASNFSVVVTKS